VRGLVRSASNRLARRARSSAGVLRPPRRIRRIFSATRRGVRICIVPAALGLGTTLGFPWGRGMMSKGTRVRHPGLALVFGMGRSSTRRSTSCRFLMWLDESLPSQPRAAPARLLPRARPRGRRAGRRLAAGRGLAARGGRHRRRATTRGARAASFAPDSAAGRRSGSTKPLAGERRILLAAGSSDLVGRGGRDPPRAGRARATGRARSGRGGRSACQDTSSTPR